MMTVDTIPVGPYEVNCYVLRREGQRDAIVVDPGSDAEVIEDALARHKLTVCAYLITHGHVDHICALAPLHRKRPAPIFAHADDARWMFDERNQLHPYYPNPAKPDAPVQTVRDGEELELNGFKCRVIATPGHSPGGVCYHFADEKVLLSGDTLFEGSVGRTDLPGGSARTLTDSIRILARLPDATRVYPGHGPSTTIAAEKAQNFFMRGAAK